MASAWLLCTIAAVALVLVVLAPTTRKPLRPGLPAVDSGARELRPAVVAAVDRIAGLPLVGLMQTTDSLRPIGNAARARISMPAAFPAGTYRVAFGNSSNELVFVANTEISLAHYVTVQPGITPLKGCVTIESESMDPHQACLTNDEIDYLLGAIYSKVCAGQPEAGSAVLNRFKDVTLAIRFGQQPGIKMFHERILKTLACR